METVTTSKGQILFREGDLALSMYVIKAGSVGVYTDYGTSGEKQIAVLKQDDFLGEMGMIEGLPRNATAVILEDATVLTELNEEDLALFAGGSGTVRKEGQHRQGRLSGEKVQTHRRSRRPACQPG